MNVRSLDLLDLPSLARYQRAVVPLHTAFFLAHGNPLRPTALLTSLDLRRNVCTAICTQGRQSLMGQVLLAEGETTARLTFLSPAEAAPALFLPLLEHLLAQAGSRGALYLLAELDEDSPLIVTFRKAGFAMYAWQRAWQLPHDRPAAGADPPWQAAREADWLAVHALYGQIVPALLQAVDPLPARPAGLVCYHQGSLQAYLTLVRGRRGAWLRPLVLPESGCNPARMAGLAGRAPAYLAVRSYQAWLEPALEEMGARPAARQAVMVRRLVVPLKELQPASALEKTMARAKPAAPLAPPKPDPDPGRSSGMIQ